MYLADNKSEHKKAMGVNKNVADTISHNECKDVLLNNKCLRHWMNRIQSKELTKSTRFCFDDKIYIRINGCDWLALGY